MLSIISTMLLYWLYISVILLYMQTNKASRLLTVQEREQQYTSKELGLHEQLDIKTIMPEHVVELSSFVNRTPATLYYLCWSRVSSFLSKSSNLQQFFSLHWRHQIQVERTILCWLDRPGLYSTHLLPFHVSVPRPGLLGLRGDYTWNHRNLNTYL